MKDDDLVDRLVVCGIGHVTDPFVDLDARTGRPAAENLSQSTALAKSAYFERALLARWQKKCRHVMNRQYGGYQCLRDVKGPLTAFPDLEAAYRVGGESAVVVVFFARHGGKIE